MYQVIIGATGISLANKLATLDTQIRDKNTEIRENRTQIQAHTPSGMTLDTFLALTEDSAIDDKIASKEQELLAARNASAIQQRAPLSPVALPTTPPDFSEMLGKTLEGVSSDAERLVGEHIAKHQMAERGEAWLSEGVAYVVDSTCPYCDQVITGDELIQTYRGFFSDAYRALRDAVAGMKAQLESALGDRTIGAIEQTVVKNSGDGEFWQKYCPVTPPSLPTAVSIPDAVIGLRDASLALLQTKSATPLESVVPGAGFTHAVAGFEALRNALTVYNEAVAGANSIIEMTKKSTSATNVGEIEGALARLRAQKARHTNEVKMLSATEARLQSEKATLEADKSRTREELDSHTQDLITRYGQSINGFLDRINAGFRITSPSHTYRGGIPSSTYQLLINQVAVDLGDDATPTDQPSLRNTLSAGDKSTLALAFFLAQFEQDAGKANKIVVFDDPFTSQDGFRRSQTAYQIFKCGGSSAQVILLSHEPSFLKLLWDLAPPSERKTLQLVRIGETNTTIAEWDIEKALRARYRADMDTLQRFISGEGRPLDVIQKIRPLLEGFCQNLYPAQFSEQDTLGVIVTKLQAFGTAHPLSVISSDLDELNVYCRRYHHSENPSAATEAIDDNELLGYVKRTLKIVGGLL